MRIEQIDDRFQLPEDYLCRTARGWNYQAEPIILQMEVNMSLEEAIRSVEWESRPLLGPGHVVFFSNPGFTIRSGLPYV